MFHFRGEWSGEERAADGCRSAKSWKRVVATAETTAARGGSTHTGFDRRPRLPFLPMTGVPKCSGLVSGSLSRVCAGKMGKLDRRFFFRGNRVKIKKRASPWSVKMLS